MNKSKTFLLIYRELREALGAEVPHQDILAFAQLVQQLRSLKRLWDYSFGDPRTTMESTPVYDVFEKSGWKLVAQDRSQWDAELAQASRMIFYVMN